MIITGAKGFAKELLQVYYRDYCKSDIFFFDNVNKDIGDTLYGKFSIIKTNGDLVKHLKNSPDFALGVGTPRTRKILYELLVKQGGNPTSIISKKANIGFFGTQIMPGCSIVDGVTTHCGERCLKRDVKFPQV